MARRTPATVAACASPLCAVNVTRGGICLAASVQQANSFITRLKGLLGRDHLPAGHGLLISHCSSVHTIGMAFPIDVIHLDRRNVVKAIIREMVPWRLGPWVIGGSSVLELPAGCAGNTQVGDLIELIELDSPSTETAILDVG